MAEERELQMGRGSNRRAVEKQEREDLSMRAYYRLRRRYNLSQRAYK